jgi:hypothetical protein
MKSPLTLEQVAAIINWLRLTDAEWNRLPTTVRRKLWAALQQSKASCSAT